MEIVSLISVFRRQRLVLGLGLVIAAGIGAIAGGVMSASARSGTVAAATARVLVDTRRPLIATTRAGGLDTIVQRAVFLATQMNSTAMSAKIAQTTGIPRGDLTVVVPVFPPLEELSLLPDGQLPTVAAKDTQIPRTPYVVSLNPSYTVPIIDIDTAAPTAGAAVTLARATTAAMQLATQSTSATRSTSRTAPLPTLHVEALGPATSLPQVPAGTHLRRGVAGAAVFLLMWCVGMVLISGIKQLWRHAAGPAPTVATGDG
ncbi:MAG: hypothetical protein ACXVUL_13085 [Solirubrobacteraceae bacterium]